MIKISNKTWSLLNYIFTCLSINQKKKKKQEQSCNCDDEIKIFLIVHNKCNYVKKKKKIRDNTCSNTNKKINQDYDKSLC